MVEVDLLLCFSTLHISIDLQVKFLHGIIAKVNQAKNYIQIREKYEV